ncbi:type IV pilin [Halobaculum sp. D14]|uniref:type IV pilin n=1 Tax=unclassified Halobaculum TaxID=2640896 RepID=UPI003EBB1B82
MSRRASTPVLGVAVLLAITVTLAAAVGAAAVATAPAAPAPVAAVDVRVDDGAFLFTHRGGEALDARTLRVVVTIDGDPLTHQPPVPFFAATGFRSGPTGPFNAAGDPRWTAGETASFRVAGTNHPAVDAGSAVSVTLFVDGQPLASLSTTAA